MSDFLRKTFTDPDGSYSIPELVATFGALSGLCASLWDCFYRGHTLDLQGFGIGLGSIVAALGAAQRMRDGLFRKDQQ